MLAIENLHATVDGKPILNGLDLQVNEGEVHAVMGPNGSGKSTLAYVIAGREGYEVTEGSITYRGEDLLAMSVEERACSGVFLAFQYPVEIPGVGSATFLKTAVNAARKHRGEQEYDAMEFLKLVREKRAALGIDDGMMRRALNVGFSGGEKKRNEMLQMALLEPSLAILDETDSGLDIDALKVVADGINALRGPERAMVVITHYQRLLDHVVPDKVHVLAGGRIVRSGGERACAGAGEPGLCRPRARAERGGLSGRQPAHARPADHSVRLSGCRAWAWRQRCRETACRGSMGCAMRAGGSAPMGCRARAWRPGSTPISRRSPNSIFRRRRWGLRPCRLIWGRGPSMRWRGRPWSSSTDRLSPEHSPARWPARRPARCAAWRGVWPTIRPRSRR